MKKVNWLVVAAGLVVGAAAVLLTALGNPGNMGFCIACFLRDTSGALGLHSAGVVQYIRPEIIGIVLGSLIAALGFKEFKGRGGSSPESHSGVSLPLVRSFRSGFLHIPAKSHGTTSLGKHIPHRLVIRLE